MRSVVLGLIWVVAAAVPAAALEYSSAACMDLYVKRNAVFHRKGLCFTREAAITNFPNNPVTCKYATSDEMPPLTAREEAYIRALRVRELELGCERR